jgi:hypothetical protein
MPSFVVDVVAPSKGCTITQADNPIQSRTFDMLSADRGRSARVAEHPVESGIEVSDHIQVLADTFTVEAFVTDSPLGSVPVPLAVQSAIRFLEDCVGKRLTVAIGGEGTFANVALEGFSHRRTAVEGRAFSLHFRQIRIAQSLSVTIPPSQPAAVAAAGAPTEADLGQQATAAGTPVSALKDFKDLTSGLSPVAAIGRLVGWR